MKKIYFGDFRLYVIKHIKEIEKTEIESYTTEWFLIRYLKKITKVADGNIEYNIVEGPIRSLIRFYVDNIDEKTELGDRCKKIHLEYRKLLRQKQSSKYS
tara:strand:- start:2786 stop:3085 length:300 start_codon:yes stop_codon:yes gene_type:complete